MLEVEMGAMVRAAILASLAVWVASAPAEAARRSRATAAPPDIGAINDAAPPGAARGGIDPVAVKAAILLDRARFSPGAIDGRSSENLRRAIRAFQAAQGLPADGRLGPETWNRLAATSPAPVLAEYAITAEDAKGPFLERLPGRLEEMEGLKRLSYTSLKEALAERFHMSEALLERLNAGRDLGQAGSRIVVAQVAAPAGGAKDGKPRAVRLEVDKPARQLRAFAADGALLATYPISVGSREKPAPSGETQVRAVAEDPSYTYNPEYGFRGVKSGRKFDIAGGPNNPVGSVWIDLAIESYGIHGTPDPGRVGSAYSHGCIRLTNWDAQALAGMVRKGTTVVFKD